MTGEGARLFSRVAISIWERVDWHDERAAQIVEFAVALPLLIVFVVGIFDFSNAFTLKQKLTNVARDAARTAAAEPTTDLKHPSSAFPVSVADAFYLIDNYLIGNNINDCGIQLGQGTSVGGQSLTWKFQPASGSGSGCGIVITINRGYYLALPQPAQPPGVDCKPLTPADGQTQLVGTCVSIQYSYQWRFGQVVSLIGGSNSVLPKTISTVAVAGNEL